MSLYKPIKIPVSEAPAITVDDELNGDSTNPLQNKVINQALYNLSQQMGNLKIYHGSYVGNATDSAGNTKTIKFDVKPKFVLFFIGGTLRAWGLWSPYQSDATRIQFFAGEFYELGYSWNENTLELTISNTSVTKPHINYKGTHTYHYFYFA